MNAQRLFNYQKLIAVLKLVCLSKLFLRLLLKHLSAILFFSFLHVFIFAQDTVQKLQDTILSKQPVSNNIIQQPKDSIVKRQVKKTAVKKDSAALAALNTNITDSLQKDSLHRDSLRLASISMAAAAAKKDSIANKIKLMPGIEKKEANADIIFYILIFILFFLGLIKTSFPKYFDSIFTLSFQATFRQTQTREQMEQNFFPAFMLNILFVLCGGIFITLYAEIKHWTILPFWELFVYSTAILFIIYIIKYLVIRFTGWVFNAKEAATEYRFVVFLINKLLGVLMIPLLFLMAYADDKTKNTGITIILCLAIFSLAVRYLVSVARIRKNLSITAFHFFVYLCAVEIMPLLVIYKVLFLQTSIR